MTTYWTSVCRYADLIPERGAAALVDGAPVAVFRTHDGQLYALSNIDPFSEASVLSRGIVGDRKGSPTVASPIYKQVFELATGVCLDDRSVSVQTYQIRVVDGTVQVAPACPPAVPGVSVAGARRAEALVAAKAPSTQPAEAM